jgi:hypothetical protein
MKDYNCHEMLKKGKTPDAQRYSKPRAVLKALPDQKANGGELQQESIWENPSKNATFFWKLEKQPSQGLLQEIEKHSGSLTESLLVHGKTDF